MSLKMYFTALPKSGIAKIYTYITVKNIKA